MKQLKKLTRLFGDRVDPKGVKMLIAALASVLLYELLALVLPMTYPMFILNTVFIVTSLNLALTKTASIERIIGTVASIALGLGCYFLAGGSIWIAPVGLTIAAFLSFLFFRRIVNVLMICSCMLMFNTSGGHPFTYATSRVINTLIGLVIAVLVAALYTHPYSRRPVFEQYRHGIAGIKGMVQQFETQGKTVAPEQILEKITAVAELELKMTRDTGVLSAAFRKDIIALSTNLNQALCRFGLLQELPLEQTDARTRERARVDALLKESDAIMNRLEAA